VAFIADVLLSRRFVFASARPRVRHLRNHVIVVGLSALGMRVVTDLVKAGYDVDRALELGPVLAGLADVPEGDAPLVFESHGLALWDVAAGKTVLQAARNEGAGEEIQLS